jgi:hypothetical protein
MTWDLKCNVSTIIVDVEGRLGYLHTPELNYPDMMATVNMFRYIDPEIQKIMCIVGGEPDVQYIREKDGWIAR